MNKSHILIVDGDHIARTCIALMLENLGCETSEAFNGNCAIKTLKNEKNPRVDAIVLDRLIPEMSGIEVLQKIHAIPSLRNIPIIMLTTQAEPTCVKKAIEFGAFDVLLKPIDEITLSKVLESALSKDEA